MGVFLIIVLAPVVFVLFKVFKFFKQPKTSLPVIDVNKNWGSESSHSSSDVDSQLIEPFALDIADHADVIASLRTTLLLKGSVVSTPPLDGIGFEYGVNSVGLNQFLDYWANDYLGRWQERQQLLNKFPQYTTEIQG